MSLFQKNEKFFRRQKKCPGDPCQDLPESRKNWPQEPPGSALPQDSARHHRNGKARPDVPGADPKAEIDPCPQSRQKKRAVGRQRIPGAQRPQKSCSYSK